MRKGIYILWVMILIITEINSQNSWSMSNNHEVGLSSYLYASVTETPRNTIEIFSSHSSKLSYKTNFSLFVNAQTRYNKKDKERSRLILNEVYVSGNISKLNYKLGKQVVRWGSLTGYSSLDMVNRHEFFDFIDGNNEDLGLWVAGFKTEHKSNQFNLKFAYEPLPSRLYFKDNNWMRLPNRLPHPTEKGETIAAQMNQLNTTHLNNNLSIGLDWKWTVKNSEFLLNYYHGINDIPLKSLNIEKIGKPLEYNLQLNYYDVDILALGHTYLMEEWTMSTEISWIKNKILYKNQPIQNDSYGVFSIAMDRIFLFEDPEKILKLVSQYRYSFLGDEVDQYEATDLDHLLDHVLITDLEFQINYDWSINYKGILTFTDLASLHQLGFTYKLSDRFQASLRLDIIGGSKEHFFGHYSDMDRISFQLKSEL